MPSQNFSPCKSLFIANKTLPSRNYQSYAKFSFDIGSIIAFNLGFPVDLTPEDDGNFRVVRAAHYNQVQSKINSVLGTGEGDFGYGQNVESAPVSLGQKLTDLHWKSLRNDLIKVRQHQTGLAIGDSSLLDGFNLITTSPGQVIPLLLKQQYAAFSETTVTDRFIANSTLDNNLAILEIPEWKQSYSTSIAITQNDPTSKLRYFFNAGGSITFGVADSIESQQLPPRDYFFKSNGKALVDTYNHVSRFFKNNATDISPPSNQPWNDFLRNAVSVIINHNYIITTNGQSMLGFHNITQADQLIHTSTSSNKSVYIYASRNDAANQIIFRIELRNSNVIDTNPKASLSVTQQQPSNTSIIVQPLVAI